MEANGWKYLGLNWLCEMRELQGVSEEVCIHPWTDMQQVLPVLA